MVDVYRHRTKGCVVAHCVGTTWTAEFLVRNMKHSEDKKGCNVYCELSPEARDMVKSIPRDEGRITAVRRMQSARITFGAPQVLIVVGRDAFGNHQQADKLLAQPFLVKVTLGTSGQGTITTAEHALTSG
jgi:hypothetical protein